MRRYTQNVLAIVAFPVFILGGVLLVCVTALIVRHC